MNTRRLIILPVLAAILVATLCSIDLFTSTKAQEEKEISKLATKLRSPRIKRIINGFDKPNEIPDQVAFELFFRTIGEGNARSLIRYSGIADREVDAVFNEATNLFDILESSDNKIRDLRANRNQFDGVNVDEQVAELKSKSATAIFRAYGESLPRRISRSGLAKLQKFINTRVKKNIQKVVLKQTSNSELAAPITKFGSPFRARRMSGGGELYLYSDAWNDESGIYGSASLSEQYLSDTSYRATVTVTSPGGRVNTTSGDWGYAAITHSTGLSMGAEDGVYSVTSDFEEQTGYYDEYGTFYGNGSYYVGSSTASTTVAPAIVLSGVFVTPNQFFIGGNPPVGSGSGVVSATISASQNVPENTTVEFDFLETANAGGVAYSVVAGVSTGYGPFPSGNRQVRREIPRTGQVETLSNLFTITLGASSNTGSVTNQLRINKIIATPPPQSGNGGVQGENSGVPAVFTLSTAPTPTPSPTPGGGGCGGGGAGFAAASAKGGSEESPNLCSPCNPDAYELDSCFQFGGVYDWVACFCGQSPIILDILGNGFDLTSPSDGIVFDITARGRHQQIAWTSRESDDAWLVLDRNRNGLIDDGSELFGNVSEQPSNQNPRQGFASLGMFDDSSRGGNQDGRITRADVVFGRLRLWVDQNHNGRSEPEELYGLSALDVVAISLDYKASKRTDIHGNKFLYRAPIRDASNANVGRWAWDVFLRTNN